MVPVACRKGVHQDNDLIDVRGVPFLTPSVACQQTCDQTALAVFEVHRTAQVSPSGRDVALLKYLQYSNVVQPGNKMFLKSLCQI